MDNQIVLPKLNLIGESSAKIWGLPIKEWQERAFKKAGASDSEASPVRVHMAVEWILSPALMKAFVSGGRIALISEGEIIGINGVKVDIAKSLIGQASEKLEGTDIKAVHPQDLDDGYNKALRKNEPPYALNIQETGAADIMRRQFKGSYKGITDFVTKWFWPVPAFYVTRLCAAMRITPNSVTTLSLIMTFAAMYYFWQGQWFLGFLTGWFMTFLDTVDGKLARTTMTYSYWGNIYDHGIDLVHPPFWYIAWFVGLGGIFRIQEIFTNPMTLAIAAICFGYVFDRFIEGIFMRQHGFHIHVWTKANSALRFFIARRNPNMFIFMIAICLTPWWPESGKWGLVAIAIWVWICTSCNTISLIAGMLAKRPLKSWMDA